ncbi:hypothetical protein CHS0354_025019 [Potamilus streckersoni]|uniref:Guanine nucleotide exchange factor DBS n=1 Tax=Potamilus streckersoni TaxID=2493646 RepID=A0AAE0SR72_9BIVA|nr:hypothetical protein CHS0354_025019 [Potamilus streckersoni]
MPFGQGDVMGTESCPYSVLDVAEVLQSNYAFLSGGKAKNGAPILTFPDRPSVPDVTEEEYKKVVTYLCSIVSLNERQMGFVVLVDRRQSAWGLVKTLFLRFNAFFPYHIQVVFLLEPHGFFQRAFSDFRSKFKEELEFKVVSISSPEEMFEYVDASQMTSEFGGSIQFDPMEWTQHRSAVEKFSSNAEKISIAITALTKRWDECLVPNDVPGTEKIIRDHAMQRKELLEDVESAETHGKTLLSCIKGDNSRTPLVHFSHVLSIEILLVQLEETRTKFDGFWDKHSKKLQQSSSLRKFEEEFKIFQLNSEKNMEWLEQKMMEVGDTLAQVETLIQEFDQFEEKALKEIEHGEKMRTNGEELIVDDHYAVDSIRPKCIELQRICDQYKQLVRRRREILTKSHDLQERIDKANKWCTNGVDMLANQQLDRIQTQQGAEKAIHDIDTFLTTTSELKLTNPKEFRQLFDSVMTADSRATVQKVLKRIEDVQGMCAKRRDSLCKSIARHARPVQPVQPEIVATSRGQTTVPEYDIKKRKEAGDNSQKTGPTIEKSARLRVDIQHPRPPLPPGCSPRGMLGSSESIDKNGMRNSMASAASNSSSSTTSGSTESLQAKRMHVLNELIETETTYVQEMHDILRGYYCEMDNRTMQHLMPEELFNKKEVLFSNLDQIYKFHHDVFLKELQNCEDNPTKVGKCFVNRKDEFQMYCVYCQNKPKSEALRTQVGDNNPFFKECQRRLGHKLPLSAYLLKPIQRITKYQLLLKEMLKYTQEDKSSQAQLEEALNTMLDVLRIVNNSMYHVSIVGYSGNLSDFGKLLLQGSFSVWTEHKKEKIRDIRFKPMQRHVFLYEKAILLCKKKEDSTSEKDVYSYKNMLRLSKVGLTENIKGDKKKFELWLKGREEVYIIQTPSLAVKDLWIREIKKVLMNQFDEIKVSHLNLMQRSTEDEAQQPVSANDSLESWRYRQGSGNNNTSTVPVGLEMMSPESPLQEHMDEGEGWSSGELSNSDDERMGEKKNVSPVEPSYLQQFTVIADYNAVDDVEISIREGDIVEILKTGSTGWWLVSNLMTNEEGWVPANFLEHSPRAESRSYVSMSSMGSGTAADHMTSHSSLTSGYSANSPVDETTV